MNPTDVTFYSDGDKIAGYLFAPEGWKAGDPARPGILVLAGYSVWSFYASKQIDSEWTLRVRVENAFDRQYQLASGYNTPGAGAFVTLQYQPK